MTGGAFDETFDISFRSDGTLYKGWVTPSDKLKEDGEPASFHVVLNNTFFGNVSYNEGAWNIDQQRPKELVDEVGKIIRSTYRRPDHS